MGLLHGAWFCARNYLNLVVTYRKSTASKLQRRVSMAPRPRLNMIPYQMADCMD